MKEITRVHLAKTPYDIEVGAKKALEKYLAEIERMMGSEEAMREIEARMVELLGDRGVAAGGVISASDVADLRQKMGEPKEFSDGENEEADKAGSSAADAGEKPVKRLMRDPDHAVLGGVCAGIGAYWGINPLWIRIVAIISPFISFGTAILIYIVMWISLPEAKTAAEKLQMRGEEVNFDTIKNFSVSDETKTTAKNVLVKIVQIFAAVCLFMVTLGLLIALMVGIFFGVNVVSWMDGLSAQPWAWGLLISLIIGGATAVTLSGVLTSSAIRWKASRATVLAVIITSVIGALSVSGVAVFSVMTKQQLVRDEARLTKTIMVDLPENAANAKYVDVTGAYLSTGEVIPSDKLKVEVEYLNYKSSEAPKIEARLDGETLRLHVNNDQPAYCFDLPFILENRCYDLVRIRVYGLLGFVNSNQP